MNTIIRAWKWGTSKFSRTYVSSAHFPMFHMANRSHRCQEGCWIPWNHKNPCGIRNGLGPKLRILDLRQAQFLGNNAQYPTWEPIRSIIYPLVNSHGYGKSPSLIGKSSIDIHQFILCVCEALVVRDEVIHRRVVQPRFSNAAGPFSHLRWDLDEEAAYSLSCVLRSGIYIRRIHNMPLGQNLIALLFTSK